MLGGCEHRRTQEGLTMRSARGYLNLPRSAWGKGSLFRVHITLGQQEYWCPLIGKYYQNPVIEKRNIFHTTYFPYAHYFLLQGFHGKSFWKWPKHNHQKSENLTNMLVNISNWHTAVGTLPVHEGFPRRGLSPPKEEFRTLGQILHENNHMSW